MAGRALLQQRSRDPPGRGLRPPVSELPYPVHGVPPWLRAAALRIVTWLILPVVICLSQRLSHACLSISNYTVKLRMAH
jgi:hypothetical protein